MKKPRPLIIRPKEAPNMLAALLQLQEGGMDPDGRQRARLFRAIRDTALHHLRGFVGNGWNFDDYDHVAQFVHYVQRESPTATLFDRKAASVLHWAAPVAVPERARTAKSDYLAKVLWHFSALMFLVEHKAAASVLGAKAYQDRAEKARKRVWKAARDLAEQRRADGLPRLARSNVAFTLISPKKDGGLGIKLAHRTVLGYLGEMPDADDLFGPARGPKKLR